MTEVNNDINDVNGSGSIPPPGFPVLPPIAPPGVDSGSSSIGPSSASSGSSISSISLTPPSFDKDAFFKDLTVASLGQNIMNTYISASNAVLDAWAKNIEEINAETKKLQSSPLWQYLEQVRVKGDPLTGVVSGALSPTAAAAAAAGGIPAGNAVTADAVNPVAASANPAALNPAASNIAPVLLMSNIERLRDWEKNQRFSVSSSSQDSVLQSTAIPALSFFAVGSLLSIVASELSLPGTLTGNDAVKDLAPVVQNSSQTIVTGTDVMTQINLFVTSLLYPAVLIGVMRTFQSNGKDPSQAAAEEFAKTVIGFAGNPDALAKLVQGNQITPYLIPLASYALGLLYAVEVGKAQGDEYQGMEPEEFRDLLNGTLVLNPNGAALTSLQSLQITLIGIIKHQLGVLNPEQREKEMESVLEYLSRRHSISHFTNIVGILSGVFGQSSVALHHAA